MANVSGIELAELICKNYPDTKMIILSGYKDFEYAKQAMKNNVSFYLIKPVKNAELLEAVEQIKKSLDQRYKTNEQIGKYNDVLKEVRSMILTDIMLGGIDDEQEINRKIALAEFDDAKNMISSVLNISFPENFLDIYWKYGDNSIGTAVSNYFLLNDNCYFFTNISDDTYVVITYENTVEEDIENFRMWVEEVFQCSVKAEIKYTCTGIKLLNNYLKIPEKTENDNKNFFDEKIKLLNSFIIFKMDKEATELFNILISDRDIHNVEKIFGIICENISNKGIDINSSGYIQRLSGEEENYEEVFKVFLEDFNNLYYNDDDLIVSIKEYARQNYSKNISLATVADSVYLHPVYLSRFFKMKTGMNFSDYLFDVRMMNAIKLLKTNKYKVNEISKMVGYNDYKYFSKLFKEYTGMTPKNYSRKVW